jgi:integrase
MHALTNLPDCAAMTLGTTQHSGLSVLERLRYVTTRCNKDGSLRYYWQRPGWPVARLSDDPIERFREVQGLNQRADRRGRRELAAPIVEGSVAWYIRRYRLSDRFRDLALNTRRAYEVFLRDLEVLCGPAMIDEMNRPFCVEYLEGVKTLGMRRIAKATMLNLLNVAYNRGAIQQNPLTGYRLSMPKARERAATADDLVAFRKACRAHRHGSAMEAALDLLLYTGQRPGDVLAMQWSHVQGDVISVVQEKTGKRLRVAQHRDLVAALAELRARRKGVNIVARPDGRALSYDAFNRAWRVICTEAGIVDLQARDLRRTAAIALAEAGCEVYGIAAITGHSENSVRVLLDTYVVKTEAMSRSAIRKLEAHQDSNVSG